MLKVENLSITYKSTGQKVIDNLSFEVKKGEIVAIMGPSGCGKTTFLNVVQGLLGGNEVEKEGEVIADAGISTRTVFQEPRLLNWRNVLQNVAFGLEAQGMKKEEAERQAKEVLSLGNLESYADYYPEQLSLGMKQRVNTLRALVVNPDLILLDELTSSLDEKNRENIEDIILNIKLKKTAAIVLVTHSTLEAKRLSDKIIKIGKVHV